MICIIEQRLSDGMTYGSIPTLEGKKCPHPVSLSAAAPVTISLPLPIRRAELCVTPAPPIMRFPLKPENAVISGMSAPRQTVLS